MLTDRQFIEEFWDKCDNYKSKKNKNKFFSKHVYKNTDILIGIRTFIMVMCTMAMTMGVVYAGVATYNYFTKETTTDFNKNQVYDYVQDMTYQNGVYYRTVMNYEEYKQCLDRWDNLVEMTEEDFENYFVVITAGENYSTIGLYVSNVTTDDSTLYIDLSKKNSDNEEENQTTITSTKIPIEQNRDNIVINITKEEPSNEKFEKIENLPKEYSKEQAIKDGCFVVENNIVVSDNKNALDNFLKTTNEGKEGFIRIAMYSDNGVFIKDVEYKNKKYLEADDATRAGQKEIYYNTAEKFKVSNNNPSGTYRYYLEDEMGQKTMICGIIK